jgi:hypothetical protein
VGIYWTIVCDEAKEFIEPHALDRQGAKFAEITHPESRYGALCLWAMANRWSDKKARLVPKWDPFGPYKDVSLETIADFNKDFSDEFSVSWRIKPSDDYEPCDADESPESELEQCTVVSYEADIPPSETILVKPKVAGIKVIADGQITITGLKVAELARLYPFKALTMERLGNDDISGLLIEQIFFDSNPRGMIKGPPLPLDAITAYGTKIRIVIEQLPVFIVRNSSTESRTFRILLRGDVQK